jgi:hypothetical protein
MWAATGERTAAPNEKPPTVAAVGGSLVGRSLNHPLLLRQRAGSHPELVAPIASPCRLGLLLV